jgi:hypothetical protein
VIAARVLASHTEAVRIANLPIHEGTGPTPALDGTVRAQPRGIMGIVMPTVFIKMEVAERRTVGSLRCLIAAIAAERYCRRHSGFPDTPEALVPEFLAAVPLDPADGEPIPYQRPADRVVVYSLQRVPVLERGLAAYDPDELFPPGVGVAVHLFDVEHRRQPPRPKPPPDHDIDEPR